jgi:hypothetical protein
MSVIMFDFSDPASSQEFTMGKAANNFSVNPARVSTPCIYVIYNDNHAAKSVYVGYARNAHHRWSTRTEVFHVFGLSHQYAKNIKCAWCHPKISNLQNPNVNNANHWNFIGNANLKGQNAAEHLLMRLMIGGLFGALAVTNTSLRNTSFNRNIKFPGLSTAHVYFGNKFNFAIGNQRTAQIGNNAF